MNEAKVLRLLEILVGRMTPEKCWVDREEDCEADKLLRVLREELEAIEEETKVCGKR